VYHPHARATSSHAVHVKFLHDVNWRVSRDVYWDTSHHSGTDLARNLTLDNEEAASQIDELLVGLDTFGCSIASSAPDVLLIILTVLSITILGWRYTLRNRLRKPLKEHHLT